MRPSSVVSAVLLPTFMFGAAIGARPAVSVSFAVIDPPGAMMSAGSGISGAGQIVGDLVDTARKRHGFVATR